MQTLSLAHNKIRSGGFALMRRALSGGCSSLRELDVSGNAIGACDALCDGLSSAHAARLESLAMRHCKLNAGASVAHVAPMLRANRSLKELSFTNNAALSAAENCSVLQALEENRTLLKLHMDFATNDDAAGEALGANVVDTLSLGALLELYAANDRGAVRRCPPRCRTVLKLCTARSVPCDANARRAAQVRALWRVARTLLLSFPRSQRSANKSVRTAWTVSHAAYCAHFTLVKLAELVFERHVGAAQQMLLLPNEKENLIKFALRREYTLAFDANFGYLPSLNSICAMHNKRKK